MEKELEFKPFLVFEYYRDEPVAIDISDVKKANEKSVRKLVKFINSLKTIALINVKDFIDIEEDYYITNNGLKAISVKAVCIDELEAETEEPVIEEVKSETKPKKKTTKKGK